MRVVEFRDLTLRASTVLAAGCALDAGIEDLQAPKVAARGAPIGSEEAVDARLCVRADQEVCRVALSSSGGGAAR